MAYHGLGPAATQLLDSAPSSSRGVIQAAPARSLPLPLRNTRRFRLKLRFHFRRHRRVPPPLSIVPPFWYPCPRLATWYSFNTCIRHRARIVIPRSSTRVRSPLTDLFYSHHLDSSRLSPINDHPVNTTWGRLPPITQIGAACRLSPTTSSTIISTATTFCHRLRFIFHRFGFIFPRLWGVAVHHTSTRHHNKTQTASSRTSHFFLSYQFVTGSLASTQRPGYKALPRI
eukprot:175254_1